MAAIMNVSLSRRLVSRLWLPTVMAVVVIVAGFTIEVAHGIFGSQDRTRSSGSKFAIVQFSPKRIEYDIFGDLDSWGRARYWDVNSHPIAVDLVHPENSWWNG
jgi:hypothetical protein